MWHMGTIADVHPDAQSKLGHKPLPSASPVAKQRVCTDDDTLSWLQAFHFISIKHITSLPASKIQHKEKHEQVSFSKLWQ